MILAHETKPHNLSFRILRKPNKQQTQQHKQKKVMNIKIETIDPKKAELYLENNKSNRPLSQNHVDLLANEMRRGKWAFDGAPIRFDWNYTLLDGQHRLHAIVKSGVSIKSVVVFGLDPESFVTMDTGRNRTMKDVLAIKQMENPASLSAMLSNILIYEHKGRPSEKFTHEVLLGVLARHPKCSDFIIKTGGAFILQRSLLNTCNYLFSMSDKKLAGEFVEAILHGADLPKNHPFQLLRCRLTQNAISKAKLRSIELFALSIKAFNYCREGKMRISQLAWKTGAGESFPEVI